jgi:hypothetical protein
VFPNLITNVSTIDATVTDHKMTEPVQDALAARNLAPGRHYADSGYASAALVVSALARWGIALIAPLLAGTSAQARAGTGYARADFTAGYDTKTVTCPQGRTSSSWTACTQKATPPRWPPFPPATAASARPALSAPPAAGTGGRSPSCPVTWPRPRPPHAPQKRRPRSRPTTPAAPA